MDTNSISASSNEQKRTSCIDKTIGVLMGGMSSEREVSLKTGEAITAALSSKGYRTIGIDVDRTIDVSLRRHKIEIAFIALHGTLGEDGAIQGLLEMLGIPYTGSSVLASATAMNKITTKILLNFHKIPTPGFQSLRLSEARQKPLADMVTLAVPAVVKPAEEGSTIGISIIHDVHELGQALEDAGRYGNEILIETYIKGRELTVGILNGRPLPIIEIKPLSGFYDFSSKYTPGSTEYTASPELPKQTREDINALALSAYNRVGCSGAARVDFILDNTGTPFVLEINTIPGMTKTSLLPMAAGQAGLSFDDLVEQILWSAKLHSNTGTGKPIQP
ncbi:MAG: D-alanine--D-alanine ligase [Deltaproteobacteria bacterium]|nr:D-alanine--D-alanine ligase [Deltaproteobacteria bacterium]